MIHLRGFPYDYDGWKALGNADWGYESVRPIFERIENNMAVNRSVNSGTGPLKIDYTYSQDQVRYVISDAAKEFGYPWATDFNNGDQIGYTNTISTIYKGIRQSAARAYLAPAAKRSNLHVVKFCRVTKLVMKGNKVVGVDFIRNRRKSYTARATKEVILSTGSIGTPQILMNSGIGPKKHLNRLGINVVADLPVGLNLQDHLGVIMFLSFSEFNQGLTLDQTLDMVYGYLKSFSGPLATSGLDFIGFINTKEGPQAERPNAEMIHIVMVPGSAGLAPFLKNQRYPQRYIDQLVEKNKDSTIVLCVSVLSNPRSVGKIELNSRDPLVRPKIIPNYLDDDEDVKILGEALKFQYEMEGTQAFKAAGGKYHLFSDIECANVGTQEYFECYARHFSTTIFHPVGTARMGPDWDTNSVVDPTLRVKGLRKLRVCDASVMPEIPTTNINPATMMIGERCADFIKDTYN